MSAITLTLAAQISLPLLSMACSMFMLVLFSVAFVARCYKRCPADRVLVIYGRVAGDRAARCLQGGGTFVFPLIQQHAYLSFEPHVIDLQQAAARAKGNTPLWLTASFTIAISTKPEIMNNAAERLLGLDDDQIKDRAGNIILGQMRQVIAGLSVEDIERDRAEITDALNSGIDTDLNKIGLELINTNIHGITYDSGPALS